MGILIICRYCERGRLDVEALTFMPDTCCRLVSSGWGTFRWVRRDGEMRPSDMRVRLLGLTPVGGP